MLVERMLYIVYFHGNGVVRRLRRMPINISYVSKKNNYAMFYGDLKREKEYFGNLRKARGFKRLEQSLLYNENLKFTVK